MAEITVCDDGLVAGGVVVVDGVLDQRTAITDVSSFAHAGRLHSTTVRTVVPGRARQTVCDVISVGTVIYMYTVLSAQ